MKSQSMMASYEDIDPPLFTPEQLGKIDRMVEAHVSELLHTNHEGTSDTMTNPNAFGSVHSPSTHSMTGVTPAMVASAFHAGELLSLMCQ